MQVERIESGWVSLRSNAGFRASDESLELRFTDFAPNLLPTNAIRRVRLGIFYIVDAFAAGGAGLPAFHRNAREIQQFVTREQVFIGLELGLAATLLILEHCRLR